MRKVFESGLMGIAIFALLMGSAGAQNQKDLPSVVAKVNGKEITDDQYLVMMKHLQLEQSRRSAQGGGFDRPLKEVALDRLITAEVLNQKAALMGYEVPSEKVDEVIEGIEERLGGKEQLEGALQSRGLTWEAYREDIEKSIAIEQLLKTEVYEKVSLESGQVKEYYDSHPEQFQAPERIRARHILIKTPPDATEAQKKEALESIQKAAERIKKGEEFAEVAKDVSQDGSASKGGDLGFFGRGEMVPEFEQAAFALEEGQVSDVVESQFGYHLIKLEEKRPAGAMSLEEVKPRLTEYLKLKETEARGQAYIKKLKGQADIEEVPF